MYLSPYEWVSATYFLFDPPTASGGEVQQSSPPERRRVREQPPCPPSSCHITICSCSRTANYVCVWQPHCQGGENKTAGKWRTGAGGGGGGGVGVELCLLMWAYELRRRKEGDFVVTLAWLHCEEGTWRFHHICLFDFSHFKMLLIGWWNTCWPEGGHYIICLFNSSDSKLIGF